MLKVDVPLKTYCMWPKHSIYETSSSKFCQATIDLIKENKKSLPCYIKKLEIVSTCCGINIRQVLFFYFEMNLFRFCLVLQVFHSSHILAEIRKFLEKLIIRGSVQQALKSVNFGKTSMSMLPSLFKIPEFHLISWSGNFMERYSFCILSETVSFHKIFTPGNQMKLRHFTQCMISSMTEIKGSERKEK